MAPGEGKFDPETLLDLYLLDYMKKRSMFRSAAIFEHEAKLEDLPVFVKTHYKSNHMDTPGDSLQIMQSHISTQPQFGTQGQPSGSSSSAPGDFPRAFFPREESKRRLEQAILPEKADDSEDEVQIIGPGEFKQPRRPPHNCEEREWPDKKIFISQGSNRSTEPENSPQAGPATRGGDASS